VARATTKPPKKRAVPDIQQRLAKHVAESGACQRYLEQAIAFRQAGKLKQAKAAEAKARECMRRMIELER
jgi:hypothetical protein